MFVDNIDKALAETLDPPKQPRARKAAGSNNGRAPARKKATAARR
jgi:hypothetical protein